MVRRDQTNEEQRGGAPSSNGAGRHAARNTASTSLREPENAAGRFAWAEQLAKRPRARACVARGILDVLVPEIVLDEPEVGHLTSDSRTSGAACAATRDGAWRGFQPHG